MISAFLPVFPDLSTIVLLLSYYEALLFLSLTNTAITSLLILLQIIKKKPD